jgi:hypothetical protein
MDTIGTFPGTPDLRDRVVWSKMISRQSPMAMPLRLGDAAEVINVLGLPLSPEGLFELLERDGGIIVDSNKPSVSKDGPQGLWGGVG